MNSFTEKEVIELYEWYQNLENQIHRILEIIPFSSMGDLKNISSPRLVPVLIESASISDSILRSLFPKKALRPNNKPITRNGANIYDYCHVLEKDLKLTKTSSLFMGSMPLILIPFKGWAESYPHKIKWWNAYNRLKHDRFKWSKEANLLSTLNALCGLHQLMTKISSVLRYSLRFNWVDSPQYVPEVALEMIEVPNNAEYLAYTNYFCTPLKPILWDSDEDIVPLNFTNSSRLAKYLGRVHGL